MTPRPLQPAALAVALVAVACHRSTPSPSPDRPAGAAPSSSTLAASEPASTTIGAAKAPPTGPWTHGFAAFRGTVGAPGATAEVRLALERRGTTLEALYRAGDHGEPGESVKAVALHGEMKDTSRFVLEELVGVEGKGAIVEGRIVGEDRVEGTWKAREGDAPLPFAAARFAPLGAAGERFDASYEGRLGAASRIRAELYRAAEELRGSYRYGHSQRDLLLEGAVSEPDGSFALRETGDKGAVTGRIEGIFLGRDLALGRWSSRTNARTFPIHLQTAGRYAAVALEGGARVIADDILALSHCSGQDNGVFPRVINLAPPAAEAALNGALRDAAREHLVTIKDCEAAREEGVAPWTDLGYAVTPTRRGGFALQLDWFVNGGARGNHGRTCLVADTAAGKLVDLRTLLTAEARKKLGALLGEATLKFYGKTELSGVPLAADDVEVARAAVCAIPGALLLQLEPRPPGAGHNWDHVEVELPAKEARPLFEKSDLVTGLFEERPAP
jgi:hypothetical protein